MKVLLSIKPEFVEKIFDGTKCFEYRKAPYRHPLVRTVVVYATRPVAKLVGEFDVVEIISGDPKHVWMLTQEYSGISAEFFSEYFEGRDRAFALKIGEVRPYDEPIDPSDVYDNFTAPQSFKYVDDRRAEQQLRLAI